MGIAQDLRVAARRWAAVRGKQPCPASEAARRERAGLRDWFRSFSPSFGSAVRDAQVIELEASTLPWLDTGIDLAEGDWVTTLAAGRFVASDALDIWVGPQFQLWMRVGEDGTIFNGARDTHSFRAPAAGRLYFGNAMPGQWHDAHGRIATPLADYAKAVGGLTVVVLRWNADAASGVAGLAGHDGAGLLSAEAARLSEQVEAPPGWSYLWFLGQSDIFRRTSDADGHRCIACHTERNVAILQHDAVLDLRPGTHLRWSWKVDELPSRLPENTQASHDYLSVAVEFENGRDITYTWSPELAAGTGYWCPLPSWKDREFHVVVRSGGQGLGEWLEEDRDLYADYRRYMGEPPARIVRLWLIAVSIFQRGTGRASFRDFVFEGKGTRVEIS